MSNDTQTQRPPLTKERIGIAPGLPLEASQGGIEELRADIQRLMDMEAIKQLKHSYFRCLDTANWDEMARVLHKDLKVHYVGADYTFDLNGADEFLSTMKPAFNKQVVARHLGHMPEIQMLSATEATGIWYLWDHFWSLPNKFLTEGTALYWDRYVKEDGQWWIRETSYERIYQCNTLLTELPEFAISYLAEHGVDA